MAPLAPCYMHKSVPDGNYDCEKRKMERCGRRKEMDWVWEGSVYFVCNLFMSQLNLCPIKIPIVPLLNTYGSHIMALFHLKFNICYQFVWICQDSKCMCKMSKIKSEGTSCQTPCNSEGTSAKYYIFKCRSYVHYCATSLFLLLYNMGMHQYFLH